MQSDCTHRENCRLCLSPRLELVVKLEPIPLAEKYSTLDEPGDEKLYPVDLYLCRDCGHVQLLDVVDPGLLWADYTYHSGQTKGIVEHFEQVAQRLISQYQPAAGSLVIDVGSNDGSLLRPFQRRGYRVLGIDPAREIARRATDSGIETLPELMTPDLARRIRDQFGPATIITAFNVFAHADDMNGMAESIRILLAPDGVFQFEAQYLLDILDKLLLGTIFHEHLSHHSLKPLQKFLLRHELELIDVERVTIQMGSIIGTAQPSGGGRVVERSVDQLLALETERRLDQPATIRQFSVRLEQLKCEVAELIADWKHRGATVAGYGAARSGPTLIVQFGLEEVIECIFDDHPQKVNRYSPGHRIPVVPTAKLCRRRPDYVIILAWIHAKKIVAANREYLEQGGCFVLCCPEVRVISASSPPLG